MSNVSGDLKMLSEVLLAQMQTGLARKAGLERSWYLCADCRLPRVPLDSRPSKMSYAFSETVLPKNSSSGQLKTTRLRKHRQSLIDLVDLEY